ncbi:16S rRNA (cytosine967-C5)-methyltransferase [bacterium A37T11]|nr:16S rRNA (cytosine967-C5)-methyltransferase [bacterium A37T11]
MSSERLLQQLRSIDRVLDAYKFQDPLSRFMTAFFKENRQMGSKDRKAVSGLVYPYFRLGKAAPQASRSDRLAMAALLCQKESPWLTVLKPAWTEISGKSTSEKIEFLEKNSSFELTAVFPFRQQLSSGIVEREFLESLLIQPDLFIRIHPGKEQSMLNRLDELGIRYTNLAPNVLSMLNGTPLDQVRSLSGFYEVQDLSSQRTGDYFRANPGESWWDACAASGGKSILLKQQQPSVNLLVSDIRNSILRNLDERFEKAGISQYRRKIIDLSKNPSDILQGEQFDGIILDAPCSGSGTWSRTPEMISLFQDRQIGQFNFLQKQLALQTIPYLKHGKPLIYITCSVFKAENEDVIHYLEQEAGLKVEEMSYLTGYNHRADTLFVARLIKP